MTKSAFTAGLYSLLAENPNGGSEPDGQALKDSSLEFAGEVLLAEGFEENEGDAVGEV